MGFIERKIRKTYQSCSDLPLNVFINILVDDKKELLYIEPKTAWNKPADLSEIWDKIFIEYTELSNDDRSVLVLNLMRNISVLENKIFIIQNALLLLSTVTDLNQYQDSVNILRTYGFHYQFTENSLLDDLKRCASAAKKFVIEKQELKQQLEKLNNSEQEKATQKDFYVHLANLSQSVGFAIKTDITVMEYCGYLEIHRLQSKSDERGVNT